MNLKKGLSFVAFGFLFLLVNLNLTLNGTTVNCTPDFIGFILFFLAFDALGSYTQGKGYLKWISLLLVILSGAQWLLKTLRPELSGFSLLNGVTALLSAVYMFLLFGILEAIAGDFNSPRESTLSVLKYVNLLVYVLLAFFSLQSGTGISLNSASSLVLMLGAIGLVSAIVTLVVLFKLRNEIRRL